MSPAGEHGKEGIGQARTEIEHWSAPGRTQAARRRRTVLSSGIQGEFRSADLSVKQHRRAADCGTADRIPKSCVIRCLPICLPTVMCPPERRRTPADNHPAQMTAEPQTGCQWHGSSQTSPRPRVVLNGGQAASDIAEPSTVHAWLHVYERGGPGCQGRGGDAAWQRRSVDL